MNRDEFWDLVEASRRTSTDCEEQAEALARLLAQRTPEEIIAFEEQFYERQLEAFRHDLWAVAYIVHGGCSNDCFNYCKRSPPFGAGSRDGGELPRNVVSIMPRLYRVGSAMARARLCPHAGELNDYERTRPGRACWNCIGDRCSRRSCGPSRPEGRRPARLARGGLRLLE